ncbi:MAG: hypothetical protein PHW82_08965 [Bacteroidales bacterium]|nr:hypothetical protein [Bacteroidales bacterium]
MTSDIRINGYRVNVSSVKYRCAITSIVDTCSISIPRLLYKKSDLSVTDSNEKYEEIKFKAGDPVQVLLGYNGNNTKRFAGFVKSVSTSSPMEVECEGYAYQIKKIESFSKSYQTTTVKQILADLTQGTDIKLASSMPVVNVPNVRFKNANGMQVLEWLQKNLAMVVYFDFDTLYAGVQYGYDKDVVKLRIAWNVAEDKELKQNIDDVPTKIQLVEKNEQGELKKTQSDQEIYADIRDIDIYPGITGDIGDVNIIGYTDGDIKKVIANRIQEEQNRIGYSGNITAFLEPNIEKSQVIDLEDTRYTERSGRYFAESVSGSFTKGGGRQNLKLKLYANG